MSLGIRSYILFLSYLYRSSPWWSAVSYQVSAIPVSVLRCGLESQHQLGIDLFETALKRIVGVENCCCQIMSYTVGKVLAPGSLKPSHLFFPKMTQRNRPYCNNRSKPHLSCKFWTSKDNIKIAASVCSIWLGKLISSAINYMYIQRCFEGKRIEAHFQWLAVLSLLKIVLASFQCSNETPSPNNSALKFFYY